MQQAKGETHAIAVAVMARASFTADSVESHQVSASSSLDIQVSELLLNLVVSAGIREGPAAARWM